MDSKSPQSTTKEKSKPNETTNKFMVLKSDYFIQKIFDYMKKRISIKIIKCNINIQKRLNININNYKDFSEKFSSIELEIIPSQTKYGRFIKIEEENKKYFHIYFNDNREEIKKTELKKENNVSKINIIIDYQINSFSELFSYCQCIESINFTKFYRNNITDMSYMFAQCRSLQKINLNNFNTENVTYMVGMFIGCELLNELNLKKFNINKVTNMVYMLYRCSEELKKKIKERYKDISEKAFDTY